MPSTRGPQTTLDDEALGRLRRTMGSDAEFRDMLAEFLTASERLLGDLERGLASGQRLDVERAAHTLKSMARMVGALALADSCAVAENEAAQARIEKTLTEEIGLRLRSAQGAVRECLA